MSEPKMPDLEKQELEEMTAEQAEEAQGGIMQSIEADRLISSDELRQRTNFVNAGGNF
jgi:hypothetical protein